MSHTYNVPSNTSNGNLYYKQYLKHGGEPREPDYDDYASAELDAELLRSSYYQKLRFRRTAKRLRQAF